MAAGIGPWLSSSRSKASYAARCVPGVAFANFFLLLNVTLAPQSDMDFNILIILCPKIFARNGRHADIIPASGSMYVQIEALKTDPGSLMSKPSMLSEGQRVRARSHTRKIFEVYGSSGDCSESTGCARTNCSQHHLQGARLNTYTEPSAKEPRTNIF